MCLNYFQHVKIEATLLLSKKLEHYSSEPSEKGSITVTQCLEKLMRRFQKS